MERYQSGTTKKIHYSIALNDTKTIYADLHYMSEAFGNLIDNAIKYAKANEDVEILITCVCKDKFTQIIFKDNGIGISEKDRKKIFQKFERASSVRKNLPKTSGFGLGLYFVFQVIKSHGGKIELNSRLGLYSEFIINLPYNENDKTVID